MDDFEAPTLADRIGRLGRYTLLRELAEGGMSKVYLARRDGASRPCVLKQLHVELEGHPTAAKRFQREAHIVAHLDHPGIARVLGAGVEAGKFCIAMELVLGQTLEAVLSRAIERRKGMPPPVAVAIVLRMLDALGYAHALAHPSGEPLRLVHRDLSPGNVMIGYDGQVKLIDFGVAQVRIDSFRTAPGMMLGTLRYMSPEQAATSEVDHRSDLYTVGAVLHEMLTGRPLVPKGRALEVLEAILERPPPPLERRGVELSEALEAVVHRALSKDPKDRWPDAASFRDALRAAAAPLGRANRTHLSLLVSQLFPDEEIAAQRWHDLEQPSSPFGAHDTEDWEAAASLTTTRPQNPPRDVAPSALPPLRSSSLTGAGSLDLVTTLRQQERVGELDDVTQPDPADFGLEPDELHEEDEPTHALSSTHPPLVRPVTDSGASPFGILVDEPAPPARPLRSGDSAVTANLPPPVEDRIRRLERRVLHLELAASGLALLAAALAGLAYLG